MHFVTSSRFLPSLAALLDTPSKNLLLEAWVTFILAYWVKRGRPALPLTEFYGGSLGATAAISPTDPASQEVVDWSGILQKALAHPDEHLVKILVTLSRYATTYGKDTPGMFTNTGLNGAASIDGRLFGKVVSKTAERFGISGPKVEGTWERKCSL